MTAPNTPEVVNIEVGPSLVAGRGVPPLAGALHPAVDRVRLDVEAQAFYVGGRGPCYVPDRGVNDEYVNVPDSDYNFR